MLKLIICLVLVVVAGCSDNQPESSGVQRDSLPAMFNDSDLSKLLEKDTSAMTVPELVKVYKVPGADDFAGPELGSRGDAAKGELIALLDNPATADVDRVSIIQILYFFFDPSDIEEEIDKFVQGINDPAERETMENTVLILRQVRNQMRQNQ